MSIGSLATWLYNVAGRPENPFKDVPTSPGQAIDKWLTAEQKQAIPGVRQVNQLLDEQRFWQDYKETTGYSPRYPGRQVHGADFEDIVGAMEWWL